MILLVKGIVGTQTGMILVPGNKLPEKSFCQLPHILIIKAKPRPSAHRAGYGVSAVGLAAFGVLHPGVGELFVRPFGSGAQDIRDNGFHSILGRQVQLPVIVIPVEFSRCHLDGRPQNQWRKELIPISSGRLVSSPSLPLEETIS